MCRGSMGFDQALVCLKKGARISRQDKSYDGKWVGLSKIHTHTPLSIGDENGVIEHPMLLAKDVHTGMFSCWTPTPADLLANDWRIVEQCGECRKKGGY